MISSIENGMNVRGSEGGARATERRTGRGGGREAGGQGGGRAGESREGRVLLCKEHNQSKEGKKEWKGALRRHSYFILALT